MYFAYVRPLLEYSDTVWDNCSLASKKLLDAVHIESARIVSGGTKLCSVDKLFQELGWEPLQIRRNKHKLVFPSTIRTWNNLPNEIKESTSVSAFKFQLNKNFLQLPKYFNVGSRLGQVLQARLRMECSALNAHLYQKILSTALHVNLVALKTPNTSFSHAHSMQKVEETCQYDWSTTQLINSYME